MLAVEQLESRDCPSATAVDLWVAKYRDLPDAELRQQQHDATRRAREMIATVQTMEAPGRYQGVPGAFRYGVDLVRTAWIFPQLQEVRNELKAIHQIQRGRR